MGRIITQVRLENALHPEKFMEFSALVDTGATFLTLPRAWREQLGTVAESREAEVQTATQQVEKGELCGPMRISIAGFRPVHSDVLFIDMEPEEGKYYEALIGYIPLEQCGAAVDMVGHRLIKIKAFDLK